MIGRFGWKSLALMLASALVLQACGGGGDGAGSQARIRLVNATAQYGAVDFYNDDKKIQSQVEATAGTDYLPFDASTYTFRVKQAGNNATAATASLTLTEKKLYTLLAYNEGGVLKLTNFADDKGAPTAGTAALRFFNAATTSAGNVDIYLTARDADLASASPTVSNVAPTYASSYVETAKGSYRLRVTGAGSKTDLRLDVPEIAFSDQQIATFAVTGTASSRLLNGLLMTQGGGVTAFKGTHALLRVVAVAAGNPRVVVKTADLSVNKSVQAPAVESSYAFVPAALTGLGVTVNGTALDVSGISLQAGTEATLAVFGAAATPRAKLFTDNNAVSEVTGRARLRLVHLVNGLETNLALSAGYQSIADSVEFGTTSLPGDVTAGTPVRIEVTTPSLPAPLFKTDEPGATLTAQRVYSLILFGDGRAVTARLVQDR
ncbi:DUF4397 domain-containing protein [Mitsuaria sp. GD03876]|uniref:DUF4397 domain-containing protein n=1 Tax=Mitsuaria sp. GD03876 TaxID=2975399 RepID=UPI00244C8BC8|nr:DUF4397 domain-containing protein [Mitsuaria sp. GD03876]MDH0865175.1 DUF4397 domain-containing protein [Mitsuaria sp. GD03876]